MLTPRLSDTRCRLGFPLFIIASWLLPLSAQTAPVVPPAVVSPAPAKVTSEASPAPLPPAVAAIPSDKDYVTVSPEGHLSLAGERVRFWGVVSIFTGIYPTAPGVPESLRIGTSDAPQAVATKVTRLREMTDDYAARMEGMGFNMVRDWGSGDWDKPYVAGDGSKNDLFAYGFVALQKQGIKVWATQLQKIGRITPEDVAVVEDPANADEWKAAIAAMPNQPFTVHTGAHLKMAANTPTGNPPLAGILADYWDPRLQALRLQRIAKVADFKNAYKNNLRLGDDPQIAIWELTNEEWWFTHMINGRWQQLPAFFQRQLMARWNAFLRTKYPDDAALKTAWKILLPGETLVGDGVFLLPLAKTVDIANFADANPVALAAQTAKKQKYSRDDCATRRGQDVIEFLADMQRAWKGRQRDFAKTLGKSLKFSPIVYDTGDEWRIQSAWMQQDAEATAMSVYAKGFGKKTNPLFPWESRLQVTPDFRSAPSKIAGKPFFVYETNTNQPDKYRAEFPLLRAAEGLVQDQDAIIWHAYPRPRIEETGRAIYSGQMQYSRPDFGPGGYEFANDEVLCASLKTAGAIFRTGGGIPAAPHPATIIWGRKSLLDPSGMDYGVSYGKLRGSLSGIAARQGLLNRFDPGRDEDEVINRIEGNPNQPPTTFSPSPGIEFDQERWSLRFNTPSVIAFSGFLAKLTEPLAFAPSGVLLDNVTIANPPDMPYIMRPDENFITFAVVATDGLPLTATRQAILSLVSTSFNQGFKLDEEKMAGLSPWEAGKSVLSMGTRPLVARVGARLRIPALAGTTYTLYDFQMQPIGTGPMDGTLMLPSDKEIFSVTFTR